MTQQERGPVTKKWPFIAWGRETGSLPLGEEKMSALFLEALRCGKGSFSFPSKAVVSRVGIQGKELTNRHMLENCFEW